MGTPSRHARNLVRAAAELEKDQELWRSLEQDRVRESVMELEPLSVSLYVDESKLDNVCEAFASVIDIKSPYTHSHCVRSPAWRWPFPSDWRSPRSKYAGAARGAVARHRKAQRAE